MENSQYQYVIKKWQKVAVSKTPIFEPFSSHFSAQFQSEHAQKRPHDTLQKR